MTLKFSGTVISWRGPAPFLFLPLPAELSAALKDDPHLSYGWGCIPARATIGGTSFTTSLMPHDGVYLLPVKMVVQRAERVEVGTVLEAELTLG